MNTRIVIILLALCVVLYFVGLGFTATRDDPKEDPKKPDDWISEGLSGLLMPFGESLDRRALTLDQAKSGSGWQYDSETGRLRQAQSQSGSIAQLIIAGVEDPGWFTLPRVAEFELRVGGPASVKFWPADSDEPDDFSKPMTKTGASQRITVPVEGGTLQVLADSQCTLELR